MSKRMVVVRPGNLGDIPGNVAYDLAFLAPIDDKPIKLRRLYLSAARAGQGSADEETWWMPRRITVRRFGMVVVPGGTGGTLGREFLDSTLGTPGMTDLDANYYGDPLTTTSGDNDILADVNWHLRGPLELIWEDPEWAPTAREGQILLVRAETTSLNPVHVYYGMVCHVEQI